jgi:hypothetical protein
MRIFIVRQHEGMGKNELHSVLRCDINICLVNQKNFKEDSQYLYLQHLGFSHRRNQCQDKHYPSLTLWHLLVIKIRVINTQYSADDG